MRTAGCWTALVAGAALLATAATATRPAPTGGTLTVGAGLEFADPAVGPNLFQYASCLKLVNYPDRDLRHGGLRLVPEAATALPRVSRDGRTYTLRVRRGFRFYPSGKPVTAADFAWVLYRDLVPVEPRDGDLLFAPEAAALLTDVVGANAVMAGGPPSALHGVRVAGRRLTIRLTRPVTDFAARLASSYMCALPSGTPTPQWGIKPPIPSAGPYYIASVDNQYRVVLRRNPLYQGPRPHRFETIRGRRFDPAHPGANDVELVSPANLAVALQLRDPKRTRLVAGTRPLLYYVALNWNRPLFHDHPRLARAVAYALDRVALVRAHAPSGGVVTDRMLPSPRPGKPLYPLRPNLARARALAAGRTGDGRVSIVTCDKSDEAAGDVVAANLRAIGLTPTVRHFNCSFAIAYPIDADVLLTVWVPNAGSLGGFVYDAASYLRDLLAASPFNHGAGPKTNFAVPAWTARLAAAARLPTLPARDRAASHLDRKLMRAYPPLVPYMLRTDHVLLSSRVGCFTYQPVFGPDLAAICPR